MKCMKPIIRCGGIFLLAAFVLGLWVTQSSLASAKVPEAGTSAGKVDSAGNDAANEPAGGMIEFINTQIRQSWVDNGVEPSPVADDSEWLRRVYLDLVGHIPPVDDVEDFLKDHNPRKRAAVVDKLLADPGYTRNFTTVWTNLSIGQNTPRFVSRDGMQKFYREAFGRNRPWNEVVYDVITAEGHYEENGAVNFILAQMQDQDDGVQLTAKATKVFLGLQVQCTQCHNHPFNDWKQDQFWQYNSFFRQVRKVDHRKVNPKTGMMVDDYAEVVSRDFSGPVYFEKRNGLMQVAYPIYQGHEVDPGMDVDRRQELGKLMTNGDKPLLAQAMVNRMWAHLMGFGFTKPVDDMGPHNPASHPEVLDRLTVEFAAAKYDVKQLIRWIANSEAYQLSSRMTKKNEIDNPAGGETPLFSHVYVKPMSAEQLYDSLIIATSAHKTGRGSWEAAEQQRREWLRQFVRAFGNDEGEESSSFDGTIPQALMMMNGELVRDAVSFKPGSHLAELLQGKGNEKEKINKLWLTVLSRKARPNEMKFAESWLRRGEPLAIAQDLFWALLNSNEFIVNH